MNRAAHPAAAVAAALLFTSTAALAATPPAVSATITATQLSPTSYSYALKLIDAAASPSATGTFWFAWLPGEDFMATAPLTVANPAGWNDLITGGGTGNGYAIQWTAASAASDVAIGASLSGFSFTSADPPSSVFGNSAFYATTPVLTSVAYSGTPFSDAGTTFQVTPAAVPEPASLAALVPAGAMLMRRRRAARR